VHLKYAICLLGLIVSAGLLYAQTNPVPPAINQLGLDLIRTETPAGNRGNLLLSPYSIETALAMAYTGADGRTREQMQRVLHLPADDAAGLNGFSKLAGELADLQASSQRRADEARNHGGSEQPIEINVANCLFAQRGFAFRPTFTAALRDRFGAPLEELDFAHAPEPARIAINAWVAHGTHDKIRNLVPSGAIDDATRAVLANALYLRAAWASPFKVVNTKPQPFWIDDKAHIDAPTMRQQNHFGYAKRDGYTAISLPYSGGGLQLLILLPDKRDGLATLERIVTPELLAGCTRLPPRDMILHLPRFRLAPPRLALGGALRGLGMTTAFDQPHGSADFDRMAPRKPNEYLYLSEVFHKTWLSLDENGTEAAAVTAAVMMKTLGIYRPLAPLIEVRVDRPFLFAIQDVSTGTCLFLGRLTDPR
jgi:serpin B